MCAKPTANDSESDFNLNGDPVELDYLLSSDLPHADGANDDDHDCRKFAGPDIDMDLEGLDDVEPEDEQPVTPAPAKRGRPKAGTAQPAPATVDADGKPLSVYQRLADYGLLRKITDIVMAKVAIPWHLRADATQEVHATWATLTAKPEFQRNQLARYAYISGQHAALKLRRTIGAVVAIPGALFRTGRDTAFMEAIGAAVNPKDVEDYKDSLELSTEPMEDLQLSRVSDNFFTERLGDLNLSAKQCLVARKALVERMAADDIAEELGMDLMYVERLLNQVTQKLLAKDGGVTPTKPARKGRKPVAVKEPKTARLKAAAADAAEKPARRVVNRQKKLKVAA
ncbi:hypothetical protein WJ96_04785 [Burkholderia ubonensis]|uniref:Uncharacterized protein n=1 Tax=Burkholderia ubonensis TaxID=101571 RepID=A0AAW3MVP3_9BURK|nr:hypothetical protein [Burkholderia ubonensis]KVP96545.1 hypothetical protein WJ97_11710 [Burkholderia ubonensis]KVP97889.1 hypothetical protein WJ96_04785 [Burkholderia ubonensis]KVZ92586.1 hypothetical protein WL25_16440 [Burkholderia ubonensis]